MTSPEAPQHATEGLGPRGRRTLTIVAAAILAATALVVILMGSANEDSASPSANPVAAENSNVVMSDAGVNAQSYIVSMPSCCYPAPAA